MSNTLFVESLSEDPVERAISRKVTRILNDTSLDRQQREALVRKAQRELIEHRKRKEQHEALHKQVAGIQWPAGYRAQSVAISNGRVQVGGRHRNTGFAWLDAGQAPKGMAANRSPFQLPGREPSARGAQRKDLNQSLAERRRVLGYQGAQQASA